MKKITSIGIALTAIFAAINTNTAYAQDVASKKVQAGIITGFGVNFPKMETKKMLRNGVGTDLTIGMNLNFNFNPNLAFNTGAEFDFETMKFKPSAVNTYYRYNDTEIINQKDVTGDEIEFRMTDRKQKPVYLTIPTMFLFRTNFIGYFRYFGKFGMRHSILLGNKMFDNGFNINPDGTELAGENNNMKADNSMNLYKASVGLAGGTEWNFSGNTCLVAELGFYYGVNPVINVTSEKNQTLYNTDQSAILGTDEYFTNKVSQSQLMLKVSILF